MVDISHCVYPSIYLAEDIWIVSPFLVVSKTAGTFCRSVCVDIGFYLSWIKILGIEWLDHLCSLFKIFLKVIQGQIITWRTYFVVLLLKKWDKGNLGT